MAEPGHRPAGGAEILGRLADGKEEAYLLNAASGEGKTTLALSLASRRPRVGATDVVALYVDSATSDVDDRLADWLWELKKATRAGERPKDVPVLVIDALNEGTRPEQVGSVLGKHLSDIREVRARLLLSYSYRHASYAGALIEALETNGVRGLKLLELGSLEPSGRTGSPSGSSSGALEPERELGFFALLLDRRGRRSDQVQAFVGRYAERHPDWHLSRRDIATLVSWGGSQGSGRELPPDLADQAPPPAELISREFLGPPDAYQGHEGAGKRAALLGLASAAFVMLGDELTAASYRDLARYVGADDHDSAQARNIVSRWLTALSPGPLDAYVSCTEDDEELRVDSEATIRVLGALYVAQRLRSGETPDRLRGRTTYDVAAPFVPYSLKWLSQADTVRGPGDPAAATSSVALERTIMAELDEADGEFARAHEPALSRDAPHRGVVPYSFYGRMLLARDAPQVAGTTKTRLFRSIIEAIDLDREETCEEAIRSARGRAKLAFPDPVLDQLFALMRGCGSSGLRYLLEVCAETDPLVKSQVAYLILAWLRALPPKPSKANDEQFQAIVTHLPAQHWNLHLRYHMAELVEELLRRMPADSAALPDVLAFGDKMRTPGLAPMCTPAPYPDLQHVVTDYVTYVVERHRREATRWMDGPDALRAMWDHSGPGGAWSEESPELHLECWETALGLSSKAYRLGGEADIELREPILAALANEQWIVRWWAFFNLVELFEHARRRGLTEAKEFAAAISDELVRPGEPVGLKQQECDQVDMLLKRVGGDRAATHFRSLVRARRASVLSEEGREEFLKSYRAFLRQPADEYLREYFNRLNRLIA